MGSAPKRLMFAARALRADAGALADQILELRDGLLAISSEHDTGATREPARHIDAACPTSASESVILLTVPRVNNAFLPPIVRGVNKPQPGWPGGVYDPR